MCTGIPGGRGVTYKLFGLAFESSYRFQSLPVGSGTPDISFFELQAPLDPREDSEQLHSWQIDPGVDWLAVSRARTGYCLRFPRLADFLVTQAGNKVYGFCAETASRATFEHLVLDQVLPRALSLSGHCILHCSSVVTPRGAIAFAGKSGQGKSILASSLALAGYPLVTDDCLLLQSVGGHFMGVPSYPSVRLWPEDTLDFPRHGIEVTRVAHYSSKQRLRIGRGAISFAEGPAQLGVIYMLSTQPGAERDERISIERLSPHEAFIELVQGSFQLDLSGAESLRTHTTELCAVANTVPMFRLCYPRNRVLLPEVMRAVLRHANSVPPQVDSVWPSRN